MSNHEFPRLPAYAARRMTFSPAVHEVKKLLRTQALHTVCEEARCPNLSECFARRTATFMILGDTCTRRCGFCAVQTGRPSAPDPREPQRLAQTAGNLGLKHIVVTSVARDDLPDEGAGQFAAVTKAVREAVPGCTVEILTPDFSGRRELLDAALAEPPDIFNHNLETVERLQRQVRPAAQYGRSLKVLGWAAATGIPAKSGIMVGLGESITEIHAAMRDIAARGVSLLTIGQYLRPTRRHLPVHRYYEPAEFDDLAAYGSELGFTYIASGSLVRSSYLADAGIDALQTAHA